MAGIECIRHVAARLAQHIRHAQVSRTDGIGKLVAADRKRIADLARSRIKRSGNPLMAGVERQCKPFVSGVQRRLHLLMGASKRRRHLLMGVSKRRCNLFMRSGERGGELFVGCGKRRIHALQSIAHRRVEAPRAFGQSRFNPACRATDRLFETIAAALEKAGKLGRAAFQRDVEIELVVGKRLADGLGALCKRLFEADIRICNAVDDIRRMVGQSSRQAILVQRQRGCDFHGLVVEHFRHAIAAGGERGVERSRALVHLVGQAQFAFRQRARDRFALLVENGSKAIRRFRHQRLQCASLFVDSTGEALVAFRDRFDDGGGAAGNAVFEPLLAVGKAGGNFPTACCHDHVDLVVCIAEGATDLAASCGECVGKLLRAAFQHRIKNFLARSKRRGERQLLVGQRIADPFDA
ncbi:hypothetical protein D3C80_359650 [compost metagenome]